MHSLWSQTAQRSYFDTLQSDTKTDVLVVGGGLTGILCSYALQQAGVRHLLIEAKEICSGITQNTTGKVTVQHGLIYADIIQRYGTETARGYYLANARALQRYRQLSEQLDQSFEVQPSCVYSLHDMRKIKREWEAYRLLGIPSQWRQDTELPFPVAASITIPQQGQLHPLSFLYALSRNLPIRQHTKLLHLKPHLAVTDRGNIAFRKAIVATHFPILNKHGGYFFKMYQHRSYLLAMENAPQIEGMYIDEQTTGLSFRRYGKYLLFGGAGHRTGKKGGNWAQLEQLAKQYFPKAHIAYRWAAQDCITLDGIPYIGQYSPKTPDLLVASGYNKWGFTSAMAAAEILCDLVQEKPNRYASVFDPSRRIWHPQLLINGAHTLLDLITPTVPRCPHMGCALKYNAAEHSWDCPCHGSRFTEKGQLIDNPATDDKRL